MTDFALLYMSVDASGMQAGDRALDSLAAKGAQAEAKIKASTSGMAKGMDQVGSGAKRMGPHVQNASYQVGDFAVQVASGQSAAIAFAQQFPQFAQGWGIWGAAMGAAVAIGAAAWPMLVQSAEKAVKLEDAVDDLSDALDRYKGALEKAAKPGRDLIAQFGDGAVEAQKLYGLMVHIERLKFSETLNAARKSASTTFGEIGEIMDRWQAASKLPEFLRPEAVAMMRTEVSLLEKEFGLSLIQAHRVNRAMDALATANGPRAAATAATDLVAALVDAQSSGAKITSEMISATRKIGQLGIEAGHAANILGDMPPKADAVSTAVAGIAGNMGVAADEAARMAANVLAAISAQNRTDAIGQGGGRGDGVREMRLRTGSGQSFDDYLSGLSPEARAALNRRTSEILNPRAPRKGGRGGKADREAYGKSIQEIVRETEAFRAQADALAKIAAAGGDWRRELAIITKEQELLNAAQRSGIELTPQTTEGIRKLAEAYVDAEDKVERLRDATQRGQDAFKDLFSSILDGADGIKGALSNLLKQMAEVQMQRAGMKALGSTSWGGGLVSLVGGMLSFDGGGFTGAGPRAGGVDGKGGFPAILHPNETVVDHTKGQSGSGSGAPTVIFNIDARGATEGTADLIARKINEAVPSIVSRSVAAAKGARERGY